MLKALQNLLKGDIMSRYIKGNVFIYQSFLKNGGITSEKEICSSIICNGYGTTVNCMFTRTNV